MTGLLILSGLMAACGGGEREAPATVTSERDTTGPPPVADAALRVDSLRARDATVPYLVSSDGRPFYAMVSDPGDRTTCYDECLEEWRPLTVAEGLPGGRGGVDPERIGRLMRRNGVDQVTYGGHPLYYRRDTGGPMVRSLEDTWGHWRLVTPDGALLQ